jgi:DNA-binding transcriptional LysR family regulator
MRRLPPLNALRVFEVAALTSSYAAAAAELGLTHGAVSRQIAILETWLGQRLFVRVGRRMVATPAAGAFAAEVSLAFDRMTAAAEACGRPASRRILRVSAPTTFAMRWLIPRLARFHAARPEVEVAVTTTTSLHDKLRGGFDVAVRRGAAERNTWPQHRAVPFLQEADTLVMSAALFARSPIRTFEDLQGIRSSRQKRGLVTGSIGSIMPGSRNLRDSAARFSTIFSSRCRRSWMVWVSASARSRCWRRTSRPAAWSRHIPIFWCPAPAMSLSFRSMRIRPRRSPPSLTGWSPRAGIRRRPNPHGISEKRRTGLQSVDLP